jgi:phage FluMu protein gp41
MSTVTNLIGAMNRRGGAGGGGGEATAVQNVGIGAGLVYRDLTGTTVNLRTIKAGTAIGIATAGDEITITNSAPESTAVANVGAGAGLVYRDMTGSTINLKTVKGGSYITVTNNADDITITGLAPGESNLAANVGAGTGQVYRDKTGVTLNLKTIKAGTGVTVTNNADDITITNSAPESTAVSNVGAGTGLVYRDMTGSTINVKSVKGGSYITVTNNADDITITGLAPGESNLAANVGTGSGTVWKDKTGVTFNFRSLNPLYGMYILDNGNNIDIKLSITYSPLTDGATIALDAINGPRFKVTIAGARQLLNPTNPQGNGQLIIIRVKQDATGNRTLTYDTKYRFSTDLPSPILSTAANKIDYLGFIFNQDDDKWDFISFVKGF